MLFKISDSIKEELIQVTQIQFAGGDENGTA